MAASHRETTAPMWHLASEYRSILGWIQKRDKPEQSTGNNVLKTRQYTNVATIVLLYRLSLTARPSIWTTFMQKHRDTDSKIYLLPIFGKCFTCFRIGVECVSFKWLRRWFSEMIEVPQPIGHILASWQWMSMSSHNNIMNTEARVS